MNSIQLKKNISLSNFTTWRIGGPAEWIAQPKNNEEIKYSNVPFSSENDTFLLMYKPSTWWNKQ